MQKEVKRVLSLAKKMVSSSTYQSLLAIKNEAEQLEAAKFAIIASLHAHHHYLSQRLCELEDEMERFEYENKLLLVPSKIKHVQISFHEQDCIKVVNLLNDVHRRMGNV